MAVFQRARPRTFPMSIWLAALLLTGFMASGSMWADDTTGAYLDRLRTRRLDKLLDHFGATRLSANISNESARASTSIAFARNLALRAAETSPHDQAAALRRWNQARAALDDALGKVHAVENRLVLRYHLGHLVYDQALWLAEWREIQSDESNAAISSKETINTLLDEAEKKLVKLSEDLSERQRIKPRTMAEKAFQEQLRSLELAVHRQRGAVALARVRWTLEKPTERAKVLLTAVNLLENCIRAATSLHNIHTNVTLQGARLDLAVVYKELQRYDDAAALLEELGTDVAADLSGQVLAERVELELARGQVETALRLLEDGARGRAVVPPRWDFLALSIRLSLAHARRDEKKIARTLEESAFFHLGRLETRGASTWRRRGQLLVAKQVLVGLSPQNLERQAEVLLEVAQPRAAADRFRQAAQHFLSGESGDPSLQSNAATSVGAASEAARKLLLRAAAAMREGKQPRDAARLYADCVNRWPQHAQADECLWQAIQALQTAYKERPNAEILRDIQRFLLQLQKSYPQSPRTGNAHYLLGSIARSQRQYAAAIKHWNAIVVNDRLRPAALVEISRTYVQWFIPGRETTFSTLNSTDDGWKNAIRFHRAVLTGKIPTDTALTLVQRVDVACHLADFLLDPREDQPMETVLYLEPFRNALPLRADQARAIERRVLLAYARQGKFTQAAQAGREVLAGSPAELWDTLRGLLFLIHGVEEFERPVLGALAKPFVDRLAQNADGLPAEARRQIPSARALVALLQDANNPAPLAMLSKPHQELARAPATVEALALGQFLARAYGNANQSWQTIAAAAPDGSPRWFRAQLYLARCARLAGQRREAIDMLSVLAVLHPDFGGAFSRECFQREVDLLAPGK